MASDVRNDDVYTLIGEVCKGLLQKVSSPQEDNPYFPQINKTKYIRKFRTRAYEILLKKAAHEPVQDKTALGDPIVDPIAELLKHAFTLKVGVGNVSDGIKLEKLLDELLESGEELNSTVRSVLIFLNCLKSLDREDEEEDLEIFHFEEKFSMLPEILNGEIVVPPFETFIQESFELPKKFSNSIGFKKNSVEYHASEPGTRLMLLNRFTKSYLPDIYSNALERPKSLNIQEIDNEEKPSFGSYFFPQIEDADKENVENQVCNQGIVTEPESPWQPRDPLQDFIEIDKIESKNIYDENKIYDLVLKDIDNFKPEFKKTWETLGSEKFEKELPFVSEKLESITYLVDICEENPLQPEPVDDVRSAPVCSKEFLKNVQLLLVGVESSTFVYDPVSGFELKKKICLKSISSESLENLTYQMTRYGTCFRNLSDLVEPDPVTGKLQIEGLIFKALCKSIKEFLFFYHASILKISITETETCGLLAFIKKVEPLGKIIIGLAELCRCHNHNTSTLGEGIGILTHIYSQVSKITTPDLALCFYSILKDCCEIYFRFLQQWIFEGLCSDIYNEFMITIKPQYLRTQTRRFWTRAFNINQALVPGFLKDLAEPILQCGKSIVLMKICDPKNPLLRFAATSQPTVKVCLSFGMLRNQSQFYEDYSQRGMAELGAEVSIVSAIRVQKEAEKRRAELVVTAQLDTMVKLKRERENAKRHAQEEKTKLLEELKDQVAESNLRKEKLRDEEMEADKKFSEEAMKQEEDAKNKERAMRQNTIKYYNELAKEAKFSRLRAEWRIKRLKLFHERVALIQQYNKHFEGSDEIDKTIETNVNVTSMIDSISSDLECSFHEDDFSEKLDVLRDDDEPKPTLPQINSRDENSNSDQIATLDHPNNISILDEKNQNINGIEQGTTKPSRPTLLDINPKTLNRENLQIFDNLTAAQRNKLKVLELEFGFTPNNNEFKSLLFDVKNTQLLSYVDNNSPGELTEIQLNRLRNTQTKLSWELVDNEPIIKDTCLTEAQDNKNKIMAHTYNLPSEPISKGFSRTENTSDAQKNRERIMEPSYESGFECFDAPNKITFTENAIEKPQTALGETPMSTVTDYFTASTQCSTVPMQSYENTPFSETSQSDMYFTRSSSGMSTEDNNPSQVTKYFPDTIVHSNFIIGLDSETVASPTENEFTTADIKMIDTSSLKVYLEKSVIIPLRSQSLLINKSLIKYFVGEQKILSHLHSLRSYFFLLNGEFSRMLTQSLFKKLYEISNPSELFNSVVLTKVLKKALMSSLIGTYANSELLTLSASDVPTQLQPSNPEMLNCLSLNYKINWPLNIIFDDMVMQQYSKVFKFLVMVGRVLWVLKEDFQILKVMRKRFYSQNLHKIHLYRYSMMQFMNALHTYLTCSVLHASWTEFEKALIDAKTLDEIYSTHIDYLKKILSLCMLNSRGEKIRTYLCNIFKLVLKFHNRIRSTKWNSRSRSAGPNYEALEKLYELFCQQRTSLTNVAEKLANTGYQPHLMQFLHALNINTLYALN